VLVVGAAERDELVKLRQEALQGNGGGGAANRPVDRLQ